jgi:hypothetical protein
MKIIYIDLVCLAFFSLLSCNTPYTKETENLKCYLSDNFQERIPGEKHTYLLIATFRCSGCVENALQKISDKIKIGPNSHITILSYDVSLIPDTLKAKVKVLLDKETKYENIGIPIANIALIKTSKGKIDKIRIINLDETDQIVKDEF